MKRFITIIFMVLLSASLWAEIKWSTKQDVDEYFGHLKNRSIKVYASAMCDTEYEVKEITHIKDSIALDNYYFYTIALETDIISLTGFKYFVAFCYDNETKQNVILVMKYISQHRIAEVYMVVK